MPKKAMKKEGRKKVSTEGIKKKKKKVKRCLGERAKEEAEKMEGEAEEAEGVELNHSDFLNFGLDDGIVKAIAEQGWARPTLVQDRFIPLALEGKDILARARTGSGKTAAFAIPLIQRVLLAKEEAGTAGLRGLVICPSKELAHQVSQHLEGLLRHLCRRLSLLDLTAFPDKATQASLLRRLPDILVSTPAPLLTHLEASNLSLKELQILVVDEADLLFSMGLEKEARTLASFLPPVYQAFLTSATLSEDVGAVKALFLHNPVTLRLEEASLPCGSQLRQYSLSCSEEEKWIVLLALLKLRLLRGKSLIFVKDIDRCYRLKLFLQQFGLAAAVLNSCLPANARCHIVAQFNGGLYPLLIAADDSLIAPPESNSATETDAATETTETKQRKRKHRMDKESGVARGIDFHQLANVLNFDFPPTVEEYVHRVGRTARGWNEGTALSFVSSEEEEQSAAAVKEALETGAQLMPYQLRMEELDGFRYRARDVLRSVTASKVREARLEELKREILSSKKLRGFFAANPKDLALLRHDAAAHSLRHQEHLRHVPDYLIPETLRGSLHLPSNVTKRRRYIDKKWLPTKAKSSRNKDPLASLDLD